MILFFFLVWAKSPIGENAVGLSFMKVVSYKVKDLSMQYIQFKVYLISKYNYIKCSNYALSISRNVSTGEVIL